AVGVWPRVPLRARRRARRSPVGLVLRRPNGQTSVAHKGTPVVTVTGDPGELTLFCFGRQDAAAVELDGPPEAIAKLTVAELGI
ncbi:TIGR03085 family protein, partial [Streptomyces goshikiensis]